MGYPCPEFDITKIDNWDEIIFLCPENKSDALIIELFNELERSNLCFLYHFTIRGYNIPNFIFNLHIARKSEDKEKVHEILYTILGSYKTLYELPESNDTLYGSFTWKNNSVAFSGWNLDRLAILHSLSKLVVQILIMNVGCNDRKQWRHYFSNMLGLLDGV